MIAAGFIGGLVNYLIGFSSDSPDSNDGADPKDNPSTTEPHWRSDRMFYTSIVLGIAASLVVPVFLQIVAIGVNENLLANFLTNIGDKCSPKNQVKAYVSLTTIFGFCMLAAISSRSFLIGLSAKMLLNLEEKINKVKTEATDYSKQVQVVKQGVEAELVAKSATIPDEDEENRKAGENDRENPIMDDNEEPVTAEPLNDLDQAILAALAAKPNTRRSVKGIRDDPAMKGQNFEFRHVSQQLHRLSAGGFVQRIQSRDASSGYPRWQLTTKGWATVKLN